MSFFTVILCCCTSLRSLTHWWYDMKFDIFFCVNTSRPQTVGGAVSLSVLCYLTEIFGPLLPPLLCLFQPLIQLHSIWEKRQNQMVSFGETLWNCNIFCLKKKVRLSFYPLKLSQTEIEREIETVRQQGAGNERGYCVVEAVFTSAAL